jgi:hypothetical protein
MMTREMMIAAIDALADDALLWDDGHCLHVTLEDFEGFDSNWDEIMREYDDPDAVEAFLEMLDDECVSSEGDFYVTYHFDGFDVRVDYSSYDI